MEMKHLGLMTISPYFNRKPEVTELFELINKHHPKFESEELERKAVYSKLFPKAKYDDQRFRDLMKSLAKLTEEILIRPKRAEVDENSLNLVRAYFERGQLEIGLRTCERFLKTLDKVKERDKHHFQLKVSLTELRDYLLFRMQDGYGMEMAKVQMSLELELLKQKSTGFILDVHDSYHIMRSAKSVFGFEFDEEQFERILHPFLDERTELLMEAQVALSLFTMNHNETDADFEATKKLLFRQYERLTNEFIEMLSLNLQNFCHRRADEGVETYLRELFQLYDWETKHGHVADTVDGKIKGQHFMTAVSTGLKVGELKWVDNFIQKYGPRLTGSNANDVASYCKALQAFYHGKFKECRSILGNLDYGTYHQKLQMRLLELRLYYELKDFELLESKIDSTRHFLSDTEFIPEHRLPLYLNFIRFVQQLITIRIGGAKSSVGKLKKEISKCVQVEHRDWLLQKCDELK